LLRFIEAAVADRDVWAALLDKIGGAPHVPQKWLAPTSDARKEDGSPRPVRTHLSGLQPKEPPARRYGGGTSCSGNRPRRRLLESDSGWRRTGIRPHEHRALFERPCLASSYQNNASPAASFKYRVIGL
jgi:hypothetical protein